MNKPIRVAMIGLDTSHTLEFTRRMHAVDETTVPPWSAVLRAVRCLRFATPFQNEEGLDARQRQMEDMGVMVTRDFDEAVTECDAIMLEINDPSLHLEYFRRCATLGKPVFLDKPVADSITAARRLFQIATERNLPVFSSSSLRHAEEVVAAVAAMPAPAAVTVWGALGVAPAGSSVIWYGVHAFEMLHAVTGGGAAAVLAVLDLNGVVAHVDYRDGRRGVVELTRGAFQYGGVLRDHRGPEVFFRVPDGSDFYSAQLRQVAGFFRTGQSPVSVGGMLEVMGMLDAAERSVQTGRRETVYG